MLKKTLYFVVMALGLAACEGLPTKPDYQVRTPEISRDTVATQATPHRKIDL